MATPRLHLTHGRTTAWVLCRAAVSAWVGARMERARLQEPVRPLGRPSGHLARAAPGQARAFNRRTTAQRAPVLCALVAFAHPRRDAHSPLRTVIVAASPRTSHFVGGVLFVLSRAAVVMEIRRAALQPTSHIHHRVAPAAPKSPPLFLPPPRAATRRPPSQEIPGSLCSPLVLLSPPIFSDSTPSPEPAMGCWYETIFSSQ